jgi:hypothetical protein
VINYDWMHQLSLAHQVQTHVERHALQARQYFDDVPNRLQDRLRDWVRSFDARPSRTLPAALLLALLWLLGALWRSGRLPFFRLRGRSDAAARRAWHAQRASRSWQRLQRCLRRAGYQRQPSETPEEFAARLAPEGLRNALTAYLRHYERLRFGHLRDEVETVQALDRSFQDVRRSLRAGSTVAQ